MQNAQETQLFQSLYKLLLAWHENCRIMPKMDRFTLGQKTGNLLLDMLTTTTSAYHVADQMQKRKLLLQASTALENIKITIRLSKAVKVLKEQKYIEYQTKLQAIGKMLGGWIASLQKTIR